MLHDFYQHLPQLIDPIAFTIGFFSVRWYSISYIFAFAIIFLLLIFRIRKGEAEHVFSGIYNKDKDKGNFGYLQNVIFDILLVSFISGLIGGRIGYIFLYSPNFHISDLKQIFSIFDQEGHFVGLFGMSYFGALAGGIFGSYVFARIKKINWLVCLDFVAPALPLGYFFGRIGNYLNGELYGRITNSWLGMYFKSDPQNLRYPSQIFEGFAEGILLFIVLWKLRNKKMKPGLIFVFYILGYATTRFISEFFRQPDAQLGFVIYGFTMGQMLSIVLILNFSWHSLFKRQKKCYT